MTSYFSIVLLIVFSVTFGVGQAGQSLRMVHVFFRHGSRTPELKDVYPTDPYDADTFSQWGYGQLTNEGKLAAYKLGRMLRERYADFLGDLYEPELLEATSTDFDRTKMTLLLVLAGLFPPASGQVWNEHVPWLPIPYQYDKDRNDFFLRRPLWHCPRYYREVQQVMSSGEVQHELKAHRKLFQYIAKHTKKPMNKLIDVFSIYQTLTAEDTMNLTLPEWTTSVYPESIHDIAAKQIYYENYNDVLKKLNGGRSLQRVIKNMVAKSSDQNNTGKKILLFSGHENNVANILTALNLFDEPHVPKYTAAVIIELHYVKDTGFYAVKVFYSRQVDDEVEVQTLDGCDVLCPLEDFIEITKRHVPVNYTQECESSVFLD